MNYNYTSTASNGSNGTNNNNSTSNNSNTSYDFITGGGSSYNQQQQQHSLFSQQIPTSSSSNLSSTTTSATTTTTSSSNGLAGKEYLYQSPLNNHSTLRSSSSMAGSNYSTPIMTTNNVDLFSTLSSGGSTAASVASASWSYSRQRYLCSKGFDLEDDLEFCPEIIPNLISHSINTAYYLHSSPGSQKFNPYTSMTFSPISPQQQQVDTTTSTSNTVVSPSTQVASNVKKTPVQDRAGTLSPRLHTPRIKKPLEIINPLTKSKVESPGIRN